jgi:hypothetical protein
MTEQVTDPNDLTKEDLLKLCAGRNPPIEGVGQRTSNAALIALLWPTEEEPAETEQDGDLAVGEPQPPDLGPGDAVMLGTDVEIVPAVAAPALRVGSDVYWWREDRHHGQMKVYPAKVTEVGENDVITIVAFGTPFGSCDWRQNVPFGGPQLSNSWSWPPAVETPEA